MPWNCLCAAKEKRKLEISAPILNIEDTHNNQLQLVPLKQQQQQQIQSIAYKFDGKQHKKLARRHSIEKTKSKGNNTNNIAAGNCGSDNGLNGGIIKDQQHNEQQKLICTNNNNNNNDGPNRKISTSKWRRNKKQQQTIQQQNNKLANNNEKVKISSKNNVGKDKLNKGSPEKKSLIVAKEGNEKITKQLTNVKFSFDTKSTARDNEKDTDIIVADESERNAITESDNKILEQKQQHQQQQQHICNGTSPKCTSASDDKNTTSTASEKEQQGSYEKNAATAVTVNDNDGNSTKTDKINENVNIVDMKQLKDENTGNYDEIPLIKVEKMAEGLINSVTTTIELNACQRTATENSILNDTFLPSGIPSTTIPAFPLGKSSESIPFIDDEDERKIQMKDLRKNEQQSHHHHHNQHNDIHLSTVTKMGQELPEDDHSARFITLHPKNVASLHTYSKQFQDEQTIKYLKLATNSVHNKNQKNHGKSFSIIGRNDESFSSPLHQEFSTSADTAEHNFQIWKAAKGKLCQVCHGSLIVKPNSVVKCFNCDLICHNWCASSMPTIRYHDTSFIIFRKWLKAQDELAFPSVHQYASVPTKGTTENLESRSHQIQRNIGFDDHYLTDSECTYTNGKICDGRNNDTVEPERKFPRRRAKSLEKCKQPTNKSDNNDDDDEINDSDDSISLIIQEPISNDDKKIQIEKNSEDDQNNNALSHENIKLQIVESINKNSIEDTDTNENVENCNELKVKNKNEQQDENHQQQQQQQKDQVQCDEENEDEEEENTSIIADETKEKLSQDVIVDVHHSNRSNSNSIHSSYEELVITEQEHESQIAKDSSKSSIPDDVPDVRRRIKPCQSNEIEVDNSITEKQNLRISDSSDRTLTSDGTSNHTITTMTSSTTTTTTTAATSTTIPGPFVETKFKANSEPFQRKKYNRTGCSSPPISITSSSSLSLHTDDPDEGTDYATVDLRRPGYIYPISEDQLFAKSSDDTKPEPIPKSQSFPIPSKHHQYHHQQQQQQHQHQHHNQHNQISDTLRLHYVTQRILASVLPRRDPNDTSSGASIIINRPHSEGNVVTRHGIEDKYEKEVISMLEQKHGKNYKVLDLESCISVVTLERLCELCKLIDQWLGSGQEKVIVLQDREDRQRLGAAIAAYLEYLDICASNFSIRRNGLSSTTNEDLRAQNTIKRNWLDLDIFSMKKFLEDFIGPLRIPSYRRYLQLFSGLLSGKIKMNSSPIRLEFISIESPPSWLQYDRFTSSTSSSSQTEWNSFIKIYEGLQCIYTSDIHIIPITTRRFLYQIGNLRLRGDILIRCYQIVSNESNYNKETMTRELLFSVQFHTCAISTKEVTFAKNELDYACDDPRFPKDNKITLHLSSLAANDNNYVFQSPLIRTEPANALAKVDSVETFDIGSSYHTQGPIDGSLYATILKSPKSHPSHLPLNRSQSVQESFVQQQHNNNVISPPPQFSNKQYDIIERRSINCNTPSSIRVDCIDSSSDGRLRETSTTSTVSSTITGTDRDILRGQSQSRSDYSYVESRPGTSQSTYQEKYNLTTTTTNKYPSGINQQSQQQQQHPSITIVETYATIDGSNSQGYQNGRQSVRSPLTLSMDSGISSSGVLNRPPQGSSVSPSSFPSQASPQEDRHRELDDILCDMLMTVQDIPDLNKSYKQHTIQKIVRSQSVIPTTSGNYGLPSTSSSVSSSHHHHHQQQQFGKDTVKRSQSYTIQQNSNLVPITAASVPVTSAINSSFLIKDRGVSIDLYDTSSTTTTLTPPPSESGRDTPTTGGSGVGGGGYQSCTGSSSNISTLQRRQTLQRETTRDIHTTNIVGGAIIVGDNKQHQPRDNIIMDLQQQQQNRHNHQSSVYPQTVQTVQKNTKVITTKSEDDTSIPYHARENSQPFTYGNVTSSTIVQNGQVSSDQDPRMIKTQSGLSSPSLVRKTLGSSSQTLRKTPPRNDFEEMLRERREKVMSEKYSISDKPSSVDFDKSFDRSWANSATLRQTNGYHYYNNEPLKRSNTLDGFHRSTSTDGISGQTWLQLQQQKLRAKKDQEMRENRRYFEEQIHTEIRNRPLRSRAHMQRYDGYASDTAAFADEVDYRRPLHVQTPYRSPDRNYHTMTTTTTTVTQKERPFATMRRANELTKRDAYGSPPISPISPISVLNTSPNGHLSHNESNNNNNNSNNSNNENSQNGLLSMAADSPSRNGHIRLESDLMDNNFQADNNNSLACTNISRNVNLNVKNGTTSTTDHIHHNVNNSNNTNIINNTNNSNSNNNNNNSNNNSVSVNDIHHSLSLSSSSPPPLPPPPPLSLHNQFDKNDNLSDISNHNYHNDHHNHRHHNDLLHNYRQQNEYNFYTDYKNDTTNTTTTTTTATSTISTTSTNIPTTTTTVAAAATTIKTNTNSFENDTTDSLALSGQLALDNLLASLAIVTSLMDQQLTAVAGNEIINNDNIVYTNNFKSNDSNNNKHIENISKIENDEWMDQLKISKEQQQQQDQNYHHHHHNHNHDHHYNKQQHYQHQNENIIRYPINSNGQLTNNNHNINNNNNNSCSINSSSKANQELTNVIADLTEFTRTEALRQMNVNVNVINCNNNNQNNGYNMDSMSSNSNNSYTNSMSSYSNNNNNNNNHNNHNGGNVIKRITSESENSSSISPSLSERSNAILWPDQVREESFSSYRSETDPELSIAGSPRPETPAFPVTPRTPYGLSTNGSVSPALPPKSPTSQRKDLYTGTYKGHQHHEAINQNETVSCYTSRRNSNSSNTNSEPQEVAAHHVKFVQDSSKYWYKPNLSREEAVNLLRNAVPGTFIVRDSTTFRNAFGLVVRVAHPPPGIVAKGNSDELVRHFLVEPTSRGVRLKGCANEPVFTSLSALVYQHSITPLALPCRLIIPDRDIQTNYQSPAQKQLLTQGAACNVLYLFVCDTESLTGEEAVRRAVYQLFSLKPLPTPTEVHFKVSQQGITLTDNTRQKFFRKHYSPNIVSFCGLDPDRHMWSVKSTDGDIPVDKKTIFAFVARRSASSADNQCHVFCDLQSNQPATAIVSFVNKVLPTEKILNQHI